MLRIASPFSCSTPKHCAYARLTPIAYCIRSGLIFGSLQPAKRRAVATEAAKSKRDLPKGVSPAHREEVGRILEQAERNIDAWSTSYTDFYPPPVVAEALAALRQTAVCAVAWGGFAQAERTRIAFVREEVKDAMGDALDQASPDLAPNGKTIRSMSEVKLSSVQSPRGGHQFPTEEGTTFPQTCLPRKNSMCTIAPVASHKVASHKAAGGCRP